MLARKQPSHYRSPEALLEELGIEEPVDIRIEPIAEYCSATVVYEPLDGAEGRLLGYGDRAFITVNSRSPLPRQRFSAAHELGHWMWDRGQSAFACGDDALVAPLTRGETNPERRANQYAAQLLLPRRLFKPCIAGRPACFAAINEVGRLFQTSMIATALRWIELDPTPLLMVCYSQEGKRWTARGPNVPQGLDVYPLPDKLTAAYQLLTSTRDYAQGIPLQARFWFPLVGDFELTVAEESVRLSPDTVLSLLSLRKD